MTMRTITHTNPPLVSASFAKPHKTAIIIDEGNFYKHIQKMGLNLKFLNFRKLANKIARSGDVDIFWCRAKQVVVSGNMSSKEDQEWYESTRDQLQRVDRFYDFLSRTWENLTIYRRGYIRLNPEKRTKCEKGVDNSISLLMQQLALGGKYGRMILLSGDLDFCVAVDAVQEIGIPVHGVRFVNAQGKAAYFSKELRMGMRKVVDMKAREFRGCFDRVG